MTYVSPFAPKTAPAKASNTMVTTVSTPSKGYVSPFKKNVDVGSTGIEATAELGSPKYNTPEPTWPGEYAGAPKPMYPVISNTTPKYEDTYLEQSKAPLPSVTAKQQLEQINLQNEAVMKKYLPVNLQTAGLHLDELKPYTEDFGKRFIQNLGVGAKTTVLQPLQGIAKDFAKATLGVTAKAGENLTGISFAPLTNNAITDVLYGGDIQPKDFLDWTGAAVNSVALLYGFKAGGEAVKKLPTLLDSIKGGAIFGGVTGAGGGAQETTDAQGNPLSWQDRAMNVLTGGLKGTATGAVLGGVVHGGFKGFGKLQGILDTQLNTKEVTVPVQELKDVFNGIGHPRPEVVEFVKSIDGGELAKLFRSGQSDTAIRIPRASLEKFTNFIRGEIGAPVNENTGMSIMPSQSKVLNFVPPVSTPEPINTSQFSIQNTPNSNIVEAPKPIPFEAPSTQPKPPQTEIEKLKAERVSVADEMRQRAIGEISQEFGIAQAGEKIFANGEVSGLSSTFPKWIPSDLREKPLLDKVIQDVTTGKVTPATSTKQVELRRVIEDQISQRVVKDEMSQYSKELDDYIKQEETKQQAELKAKASKIGKSIEAKAIETKLSKGFDKIAEYNPITIKEQAAQASYLVNSDIELARKVVSGTEPLPSGLRGTSLITAMEEYIKRNPNPEIARELANSPLVTATSTAAQELRLAAERVPDSATAKLQEVKRAREMAIKAQELEKVKTKQLKELKESTKKTNLTKEEVSWEKFLSDIKC